MQKVSTRRSQYSETSRLLYRLYLGITESQNGAKMKEIFGKSLLCFIWWDRSHILMKIINSGP